MMYDPTIYIMDRISQLFFFLLVVHQKDNGLDRITFKLDVSCDFLITITEFYFSIFFHHCWQCRLKVLHTHTHTCKTIVSELKKIFFAVIIIFDDDGQTILYKKSFFFVSFHDGLIIIIIIIIIRKRWLWWWFRHHHFHWFKVY